MLTAELDWLLTELAKWSGIDAEPPATLNAIAAE